MTRPALLVVGHGTRDDVGAEEFRDFIDVLRERAALRGIPAAAGGFIELSAPALRDAVGELVSAGHAAVGAVPLVLVAAGHAKGDIPGALRREQQRHPALRVAYGRPLGPHPALLSMVTSRVDGVLDPADRADTTVLMVGRGASDPAANAEVVTVARLLWETGGFAGVETAFVSLARPSVPDGLERARLLGAKRIVVAPYFLFGGVLPDRVRAQARAYADANADVEVRVSDLLHGTEALADLVLERYEEALAGDIRMSCDICVYRAPMPGFEHRVGAAQLPHDHPDDPAHGHHGHPHGDGHGQGHGHH